MFWKYGGVGDDVVTDFDADADVINLAPFYLTWAQVQAATQDDGSGNTVLSLEKAGTITLEGVVEADLGTNDFIL